MSCNVQITDKQYATFLIFTAYLTHSLLIKMKKTFINLMIEVNITLFNINYFKIGFQLITCF